MTQALLDFYRENPWLLWIMTVDGVITTVAGLASIWRSLFRERLG